MKKVHKLVIAGPGKIREQRGKGHGWKLYLRRIGIRASTTSTNPNPNPTRVYLPGMSCHRTAGLKKS